MNTYIYSAKTNMFYPISMKDDYIKAGSWPDDGIEVDESVFMEFAINDRPDSKIRIAGEKGLPAWGDVPPLSQEELIAQAGTEKTRLLAVATEAIAPLQDAVDLEMATDEETTLLKAWKKYRVLLNRVNTSTAPDIEWPQVPV